MPDGARYQAMGHYEDVGPYLPFGSTIDQNIVRFLTTGVPDDPSTHADLGQAVKWTLVDFKIALVGICTGRRVCYN